MAQAKSKTTKNASSRRKHIIIETLGWYGAVAILLAYGLASFNILGVHSAPYLVLNLTGALGILTVAVAKRVGQSVLINAFWAVMALVALIQLVIVR